MPETFSTLAALAAHVQAQAQNSSLLGQFNQAMTALGHWLQSLPPQVLVVLIIVALIFTIAKKWLLVVLVGAAAVIGTSALVVARI
jgi:hypothetical protein